MPWCRYRCPEPFWHQLSGSWISIWTCQGTQAGKSAGSWSRALSRLRKLSYNHLISLPCIPLPLRDKKPWGPSFLTPLFPFFLAFFLCLVPPFPCVIGVLAAFFFKRVFRFFWGFLAERFQGCKASYSAVEAG